jgi:hypothetical protein
MLKYSLIKTEVVSNTRRNTNRPDAKIIDSIYKYMVQNQKNHYDPDKCEILFPAESRCESQCEANL